MIAPDARHGILPPALRVLADADELHRVPRDATPALDVDGVLLELRQACEQRDDAVERLLVAESSLSAALTAASRATARAERAGAEADACAGALSALWREVHYAGTPIPAGIAGPVEAALRAAGLAVPGDTEPAAWCRCGRTAMTPHERGARGCAAPTTAGEGSL